MRLVLCRTFWNPAQPSKLFNLVNTLLLTPSIGAIIDFESFQFLMNYELLIIASRTTLEYKEKVVDNGGGWGGGSNAMIVTLPEECPKPKMLPCAATLLDRYSGGSQRRRPVW